MKQLLWLPLLSLGVLLFTGCASNTSSPGAGDTGPFDDQGNYRDDWADDPTKWRRPGGKKPAPQMAKIDQPPADALPIVESAPPTRPPTSTTAATASKIRPAVASKPKPKTKPKPKVTRYTVKKGDTLSAIASRNGSSVSAIQKANGIKGSLIRPGQSLVVPKH